ncbi:MAG TPA: 2-C-methyl-D-erythritol 2,4-cyclodiphosphate synthase [Candidatus Dadabacteria bacterium]|jgi:2-C-methyl-D-erythritol 2,4-cyclodiphosphate synthase|nr:2-C-methyl-D-erythritol 2,4-cyclodiphosphate synthase [Candidatus Dadabacteria bacterium]
MYRIGLGYDIHRLVKNRKLFIGGIPIPSSFGLDGHSDADLLIHSICDSILGALAKGDIGTHFSNKNPKYKNKRSNYFLVEVLKIMRKEGYRIINIDSTLICEKPKLNRYKNKITKSLEKKLKTPKEYISVKATTSEGLGPIGMSMAIACKTVVLIKKQAGCNT